MRQSGDQQDHHESLTILPLEWQFPNLMGIKKPAGTAGAKTEQKKSDRKKNGRLNPFSTPGGGARRPGRADRCPAARRRREWYFST
jgi:hypothetical protein